MELLLAALLVGAYKGQTMSSLVGIMLTTRTLVVHGLEALVLVLLPVAVCVAVAIALWDRRRLAAAWSGPAAWAAVGSVLAIESILGLTSLGACLLPVVVPLSLSLRLIPGSATAVRGPHTTAIDG